MRSNPKPNRKSIHCNNEIRKTAENYFSSQLTLKPKPNLKPNPKLDALKLAATSI